MDPLQKIAMDLSRSANLADVVREMGVDCTATKQSFLQVLNMFPEARAGGTVASCLE